MPPENKIPQFDRDQILNRYWALANLDSNQPRETSPANSRHSILSAKNWPRHKPGNPGKPRALCTFTSPTGFAKNHDVEQVGRLEW